jgi:hypothetical protein
MSHHIRRNLSRIGAVIVGAVACWALYQSLITPSRDTRTVRDRLRQDNLTLCAYFRGEDAILGQAAAGADPTVTNWLNGLRVNARAVVRSPICPGVK